MNADNEPAISVAVYFKSVKKWKYVLRKNKKQKQKDQKKESKITARVEPRTSDVFGQRVIYWATTTNIILPVDAVRSQSSTP